MAGTPMGSELVARAPWTGPLGAFADLAGIGSLRGRHNIQNALAASACALMLGVPPGEVAAALATFPGLPHRLEEIGRVGRVLFINDSKATNADSAATALAAFERDVFWILGGKPKEGGITSLAPFFPRIAKAYLIGEASEEFAATLDGKVAFERCGTLDVALAAAARDAAASAAPARPSPSCCSRPPAPPTTSTPTSRCAATASAPSSPPCPASRCGGRGDDDRRAICSDRRALCLPLRRRHRLRREEGEGMRPRLDRPSPTLPRATADPSRWTHRVGVTRSPDTPT